MKIVEIKQTDDLMTVARKCNENFKQVTWDANQSLKKQGLIDAESINASLTQINDDITNLENVVIPADVASAISAADIPGQVSSAISAADIPGQVSTAITNALSTVTTTTVTDFFTEDACTVTAGSAMRWGKLAFVRLSYRLSSALTVPSNGDVTDVTLGTLKAGWRPYDMTNVILDQTRIAIGDVDTDGVVKLRSANSRGASYTIDANAVLYASMMLELP